MNKPGFVYILTNTKNTALYTGVSSKPLQRIGQHKLKHTPGSFSYRYNLDKLVYYEVYDQIPEAIAREKQIKKYKRNKKKELIESINPDWKDLYNDLF